MAFQGYDFTQAQVISPPPAPVQSPGTIKSIQGAVPFWAEGSLPDVFDSPSAWDTLWVAGVPLPGKALVQGARKIKVDQRDAAGTDGSTLTFLGRDSSEITVKLEIWTADQLAEWAKMAPKLQPPPTQQAPEPFDVYHPALAVNAIKSLYLLDVGILAPMANPGVFETQLRFIEFLNPKAVKPTTAAYSASGTGKQGAGKPQTQPIPSKTGAGP